MRRARPYRGENPEPGKDVHGELDLRPGIREPGKDVHGELDLRPGIREQPRPNCDIDRERRSNKAPVSRSEPKTAVHSSGRLLMTMVEPRSLDHAPLAFDQRQFGRRGVGRRGTCKLAWLGLLTAVQLQTLHRLG